MKTGIILFFAIAAFAGGLYGSWWVKNNHLAQLIHSSSTPENSRTQHSLTNQGIASKNLLDDETSEGELAVRPDKMSVEELVRLGMDLKQREKRLKKENEKLNQREIHQQIALAEIQQEQAAVDEIQTQVRSELAQAQTLIDRLIQARQSVIDQQNAAEEKLKKIEEVQIEVDDQHSENTKKLAQWIQSMDEEKAAEVLREMANDGKMPIAVQILSHLEEREAAKILSSLDDAKLVQDLVSEFRNLKAPKQSDNSRRITR